MSEKCKPDEWLIADTTGYNKVAIAGCYITKDEAQEQLEEIYKDQGFIVMTKDAFDKVLKHELKFE